MGSRVLCPIMLLDHCTQSQQLRPQLELRGRLDLPPNSFPQPFSPQEEEYGPRPGLSNEQPEKETRMRDFEDGLEYMRSSHEREGEIDLYALNPQFNYL